MALDHYVSQVHLKNFYSPALDSLMHAARKSDLKFFKTKAQDVCRIEEGNTNAYLLEDRAIEEFLKDVEPRYNSSLMKLRENKIDDESIFCISAFVSYLICCSPAGMRINSEPLRASLESTAAIMDSKGLVPKAPDALGNKTLSELLAEKEVKFNVDPKYPQAMAISSVKSHVSIFGNSLWEILINEESDSPFFTSDYPVAIETLSINEPIRRIIPLAPDIAVKIIPDIKLSGKEPDLSFSKFRSVQKKIEREEVIELNRLIVQSAEDLVFYRDDKKWIKGFINRNRHFRIEPITMKMPTGTGELLVFTSRIKEVVERNN